MTIEINGGILKTNQKGYLKNYSDVWYHENAIANILSLSNVKRKYRVTYDSAKENVFIVHKPKELIIFQESPNGLYYHNTIDRNVVLLNTVEENMTKYSKRQVQRATVARGMYSKVGCPLLNDFKKLVENQLIGYADDSTLLAVIRRPSDRPRVEASISRDLAAIHSWCRDYGMILNPGKTKSMILVGLGLLTLLILLWFWMVLL